MRSLQFQIESLLDVLTFLLQRLDPEEAKCFDKRIFTTITQHHIDIVQNIEARSILEVRGADKAANPVNPQTISDDMSDETEVHESEIDSKTC